MFFSIICVEISATKPLAEEFDVDVFTKTRSGWVNDSVTIRVFFQWKPQVCSHYQIFGHSLDKCYKKKKKNVTHATNLIVIPPSLVEKPTSPWVLVGGNRNSPL